MSMNARYFRVAIIAYKLASTSSTSTSDSVNAPIPLTDRIVVSLDPANHLAGGRRSAGVDDLVAVVKIAYVSRVAITWPTMGGMKFFNLHDLFKTNTIIAPWLRWPTM